ncbi:tyrosine-type recombinase/integrase [Streptomyces sp. NPDC096153]|uniref:tyrosine-type recombinase/integrase n=1 Tax=Streptomyces sp. NPDC096153 TaxID=3155548 RepID=UPI0033204AF9
MRRIRKKVDGLPETFRFHDLRHFFASLLIASGSDAKVVQRRLGTRPPRRRRTLTVTSRPAPTSPPGPPSSAP